MSLILFISLLHFLHFNKISDAVCRSKFFPGFFTEFSPNSFKDPITFISPHLHFHIGIGIPQYLCLEIFQSSAFRTQDSNFSFANSGCHFTPLFSSSIFCFIGSTFMNHWLLILNIKGDLHLQHNGYLCSTFEFTSSLFVFSSTSRTSLSASFTNNPENWPASSVYLQESSKGLGSGNP